MMTSCQPRDDNASATVLLVDDEVLIRALLAEELRGRRLAVVEAADADEAWGYLRAGGRADLLFSDITMPGSMNGVELTRRVRASYPEIKVIIMSGNPGTAKLADLGVFLAKPYRLQVASDLVVKLLGLEDEA